MIINVESQQPIRDSILLLKYYKKIQMDQAQNSSQEIFESANLGPQVFDSNHNIEQSVKNRHKQDLLGQKTKNIDNTYSDTYTFPIKLLLLDKLEGKKQFQKLMKKEGEDNRFDKGWRVYKQKLINQEFSIYIRCINCKAIIHYHQNNDHSWTLIKYKNIHHHSIEDQNGYKLLTKLSIFQNSSNISKPFHKNTSTQPISRRYLLKKKKELIQNTKFLLIKQLLKFLNYNFRYEHNKIDISKEGYPDLLVAVLSQAQTDYKKYGECINYEITHNCIEQTSFNGKKFSFGLFSAFDNNKRVIILGFSIFTFETIYDFQKVFSWFFQMIGKNQTTAIITDQHPSIIEALQVLKKSNKLYKYHHIYDHWHFIKNFIIEIKKINKQSTKNIINQLTKLMRQSDPIIGENLLKKLEKVMKDQNLELQYKKFTEKLRHICVWKMPQQFIGLSYHSQQTLVDVLKTNEQSELNLYDLIQKLQKIWKQKSKKYEISKQYENYPFQTYYDDDLILQIRHKISKKVFNKFIYYYNRSQLYQLLQFSSQFYKIRHYINHYQYCIQDFKCPCGNLEKTGVPCQHLIFVLRQISNQKSYLKLFNKRWLLDNKQETNKRRKLSYLKAKERINNGNQKNEIQ